MSCRHPRVDRIYKDGGYTCAKCDHFVSREAIRRGKTARQYGKAWRALADEARLVSQWHDAVDPMPDELRAELRDLGVSARRLLAIPEAQEDDRE